MKKLRKSFIFSLILIMVLNLCGCGSNRIDDEEVAEELINQVYEYLQTEDTEGLKSLFSKNVLELYDLDKEIEGMFEFLDGNIVSYGRCSAGASSENISYGRQVYLLVAPWMKEVKTDTESVYDISVLAYIVNEDDEEEVGISLLKIRSEAEVIYYVGEK